MVILFNLSINIMQTINYVDMSCLFGIGYFPYGFLNVENSSFLLTQS